MKRRPLAPALVASLALVASAALHACGPATWSEARDAAADASPLTRAELAFVVDHDPAAALAAAESILATADPASPEAGRALMLALEASRASGDSSGR
ncbi:MAG: hypothetical protein U1F43_09810 [Myxococcota bacterium]